jgi:hypothetical protein
MPGARVAVLRGGRSHRAARSTICRMDTNTQTVIRLADLRARVDCVRSGNDLSPLGPAMAELVTGPPDAVDQQAPNSNLKREHDLAGRDAPEGSASD